MNDSDATSPELAESLRAITARLDAMLALALEDHRRDQPGSGKSSDRTLDALLVDSGLTTAEVARLLGKSRRAVNLQLEKRAK